MKVIKIVLMLVFAVSICNSQGINISGSVVDNSGKAIAGATVLLEKMKISTKTDTNGVFSLLSTTGSKSQITLATKSILNEPYIQNGQLNVTLAAPSIVDVAVFTIQGRQLSRVNKTLGAGTHVLDLPVNGKGLFLCRAKIGNTEYLLKETGLVKSYGIAQGRSMENRSEAMAKQAKASAAIDDTLFISKNGFFNYREVASESVKEMAPIKMIANAGNVTDIDGNVYQSVRIGTQVWTTENLRVTRYRDGAEITKIVNNGTWDSCRDNQNPAYCYYNNSINADSIKKFGALYNWHTVHTGKLAPAGWHVPTDAEWTTLEKYMVLHGYNWDGTTDTGYNNNNKIAKSLAAKTDWETSATTGVVGCYLTKNNSSGFSALPGGYRDFNGNFFFVGYTGYWWSATEYNSPHAWYSALDSYYHNLFRSYYYKNCGFSVRLVKD